MVVVEAYIYIVACQRGGVSNKPLAATRHGARDPLVRPQVDQKLDNHLDKKI